MRDLERDALRVGAWDARRLEAIERRHHRVAVRGRLEGEFAGPIGDRRGDDLAAVDELDRDADQRQLGLVFDRPAETGCREEKTLCLAAGALRLAGAPCLT